MEPNAQDRWKVDPDAPAPLRLESGQPDWTVSENIQLRLERENLFITDETYCPSAEVSRYGRGLLGAVVQGEGDYYLRQNGRDILKGVILNGIENAGDDRDAFERRDMQLRGERPQGRCASR